MSAPELSAEERATVERFEAAPDAPESLRERVAQVIWEADAPLARSYAWQHMSRAAQDNYRRLAAAAIAVMRGE